MLSTVQPSGGTHHNAVRRPALFLSPYSMTTTGSSSGRLPTTPSGSPSMQPKLQQQQQQQHSTTSSASSTSGTTAVSSVPSNGSDTPGTAGVPLEVRLAVLGSLGVGKSALVVKYITRRFIQEYDPFLEDIYGRTETIDGRQFSVRIMDTSDSPGKRPERYLKWANGFIVVYSIVSRESYDEASRYLDELSKYQRLTAGEAPVVLVGNKADLERYRTVSRSAGEDLATQYDCAYFETSAAEDYASVSAAFGRLLTDGVRLVDRQPALQSLFISEDRYKASPSKVPSTSLEAERKDDTAVKQQLNSSSAGSSRRSAAAFKLFNKIFN